MVQSRGEQRIIQKCKQIGSFPQSSVTAIKKHLSFLIVNIFKH